MDVKNIGHICGSRRVSQRLYCWRPNEHAQGLSGSWRERDSSREGVRVCVGGGELAAYRRVRLIGFRSVVTAALIALVDGERDATNGRISITKDYVARVQSL